MAKVADEWAGAVPEHYIYSVQQYFTLTNLTKTYNKYLRQEKAMYQVVTDELTDGLTDGRIYQNCI